MREYMYKCCTAQPRHTVPKGQTFAGGLGPLACGHCSVAPAGSPLEGRGGGGDRQTPLPDVILTTLGIPDYQDFRAQDLRLLLVPHLGNTVTGYTPKQQATGASPGHDGAG